MGRSISENWQNASEDSLKAETEKKRKKEEELAQRIGAEVSSIGEDVDDSKIEKDQKIERVIDDWNAKEPSTKLDDKAQKIKDELTDWQNS